ncbi:MAG: DNA mismatch repair protein MutH [Sandaracinaceae bacterium]|nr:DNA mismatch repair protein MutH [Sandaracinaceae bacterium]
MPSETDLLARARSLGGCTIGELARDLGLDVPADLRRHKGFVGRLAEQALGATAGSSAGPDFPELGLELKTLPVDRTGTVRESTYVCRVPLARIAELDWGRSPVRKKLARILFWIVELDPQVELRDRRFGAALCWSPSSSQESLLSADWHELAGLLGSGEVEDVDARRGVALQIRPKAASSRVVARAFDGEGAPVWAKPRGVYLRARFTTSILRDAGLTSPDGS